MMHGRRSRGCSRGGVAVSLRDRRGKNENINFYVFVQPPTPGRAHYTILSYRLVSFGPSIFVATFDLFTYLEYRSSSRSSCGIRRDGGLLWNSFNNIL